MKYFYDFEFLDDGNTIDQISLGIVREDNAMLYWINSEFDWSSESSWNRAPEQMKWLVENVKPYVDDVSMFQQQDLVTLCCDKNHLVKTLSTFIVSDPDLWGYYSSYDHVALAQLFGPMIKWPYNTMHTNDIKQLMSMFNVKKNQLPKNDNCHNALSDALWCRDAFYEIEKLLNCKF